LTLLSAVLKAGFEHADHWVTPALEAALSHWLLAGPDEEKVGVPEPWLAARATSHHRQLAGHQRLLLHLHLFDLCLSYLRVLQSCLVSVPAALLSRLLRSGQMWLLVVVLAPSVARKTTRRLLRAQGLLPAESKSKSD